MATCGKDRERQAKKMVHFLLAKEVEKAFDFETVDDEWADKMKNVKSQEGWELIPSSSEHSVFAAYNRKG